MAHTVQLCVKPTPEKRGGPDGDGAGSRRRADLHNTHDQAISESDAGSSSRSHPAAGDDAATGAPATAGGPDGWSKAGGKAGLSQLETSALGRSPEDCAVRRDTEERPKGWAAAAPLQPAAAGAVPVRLSAVAAGLVPPLQLPAAGPTSGSYLRSSIGAPSARGAGGASRNPPKAASAGAAGAVPALPPGLSSALQEQLQQQLPQLPRGPASGARTRRLSVTLPSSLLYGEGPLTARRLVATATTGVTSHALCTGGLWAAAASAGGWVARGYGSCNREDKTEWVGCTAVASGLASRA